MKCEIGEFSDGSLSLELGDTWSMETDLVFASGCMRGDPQLEEQRSMLQELVKAWEFYTANDMFNVSETTKGLQDGK